MQRMFISQLRELPLMETRHIKIGTRGSQLALWQANWVKSALESRNPGISVDLLVIKTKGDKILDVPLAKIGGKGLFVKEIEEALLDGRIDLAVHSMKDMPAEIPDGLCICAIPERENPKDVLISRNGLKFHELPEGSTVGTGSLRRAAQLRYKRPDLLISPLRGNLDTRLRKLETGDMDAVILAAAGLRRLQFEHKITEYLDPEIMLPAAGQGALCIETRENDSDIASVVSGLDDPETRITVTGERAFLNRLEGGCQIPVAAHGTVEENLLVLSGLVAEPDGSLIIRDRLSGTVAASESIGIQLAENLLSMGAKQILEKLTTAANS